MIGQLFKEKEILGLGLTHEGRLKGFAFLRPVRQFWHLGPVLAGSNEDFTTLLDAAALHLGGELVLVDALQSEVSSMQLKQHGFVVQRRLTRMTLDKPREALSNPELRAAMAFAWG